MQKPVIRTDFQLPGQKDVYKGKVRDVYNIKDEHLVMIVTDRISAFDVVLPRGIPYKGQVLNQIADRFLDASSQIVPTWKIATPDPNVMVGHNTDPYPVEMVVRGYLTGHAWREYKAGKREICGEPLPEGMKQHQKFERPILTPTTKAHEGHDEDISKEEIIRQGLVTKEEYEMLEDYSLKLFDQGTRMALDKGLILVDTKYEFGKKDGKIFLIDEVHTPDSSRYFYADGYLERFEKGEPQRQLSKEFVREWLIEQGFQGEEGQQVPEMNDDFIRKVSERYIELFEKITGEKFQYTESENVEQRIEQNIKKQLEKL
ncbi:MAG TPA: phosphoribosylaminoimidazolesuccinocarboxamide synthase [Bacteroidales bacterium]|nr:phosphoribosylaminoimidazolesuccinocarboxamide synthase [Bacteroidales bacterium]